MKMSKNEENFSTNKPRSRNEYYLQNRDKILARQKKWYRDKYATDPEFRNNQNERSKKRYWENREEILKYMEQYRRDHTSPFKEKKKRGRKPIVKIFSRPPKFPKKIKEIMIDVKKVEIPKPKITVNTSNILANVLSRRKNEI